MKKILLSVAIVIAAGLFTSAAAQFRPTANVDSQPAWGPSGHQYVEYYFIPEIETYYYVPRQQFIYKANSGYWTFSSTLPKAKRNVDLYSANKVVINEPGAYRNYGQHKVKFAGNTQSTITKATPKERVISAKTGS